MQSLVDYPQISAKKFVKNLISNYNPGILKKVREEYRTYDEYQDDPVGFGEEVLGNKYTDDIKKVMEAVRDYRVVIVRSCNGPGKTHGGASIAAWFYKSYEDSQVFTVACPEDNLKKLLWKEINSLVAKNPVLFSSDKKNVLNIERNPSSFITGITISTTGTPEQRQAKASGKHAPHLLFLADEGDAIPPEVYKGIESCMSGGDFHLVIFFNPRHASGPVYHMEREGKAHVIELSAFNHPNVITGEQIIPGAVDRETTCRRINQWARLLKDGETVLEANTFTLPDFLVGYVAKNQKGLNYPPLKPGVYVIKDSAFSYMVLGRYPAQAVDQLISQEWLDNARSRWDFYVSKFGEVPPKKSTGQMGVDVAEFGNDETQCAFMYGSWMDQFVGWSGVDPIVTGEKAAEEYFKREKIRTCAVDGTGVGAGVAPHMMRLGCDAHTIKVAERAEKSCELGDFFELRDQLIWDFREWLRTDEGAMIPPDNEFYDQCLVFTYEKTLKGKIKVMSTKTVKELMQGKSPDKFMAAVMSRVKVKKRPRPNTLKEKKVVRYG